MKILLLSFAFLGILTFAGCSKQINQPAPSNSGSNLDSTLPIPEALPEVEVVVKDLNSYNSSDELLTDIDAAMEDLDNL